MRIRPYQEADLDALREIHARQGFDYNFPDLSEPIFVSKIVLQDESGCIAMASLARLTCEIYLLADPAAGTPLQRYEQLLALQGAGQQDLLTRGLEDAHAWLPPSISERFGRRLETFGWVRDDLWTPYCKHLRD
ncbi:MAG: hypothetical protein WAJ92_09355 [Candidatus Acidiferrales bacterium]